MAIRTIKSWQLYDMNGKKTANNNFPTDWIVLRNTKKKAIGCKIAQKHWTAWRRDERRRREKNRTHA